MNIKFFGDFEMKHPILCTFLALVLTFTTALPFTGLHATELWNSKNSQKNDGDQKTYYYTKSKPSSKGGITLYNKKSKQTYVSSNSGNLKATLEGYKKVKFSGQHPSDLWKYMSDSAIQNRQADIDNALQIEYDTRKKTAKHMVNVFKEVQKAQAEAKVKYQKELDEYYAMKEAEELAKQQKKENALNGGTAYKGKSKNKSYVSKGNGKKVIYSKSSSDSKTTSIKLNKPKKIFNSLD